VSIVHRQSVERCMGSLASSRIGARRLSLHDSMRTATVAPHRS